MLSRIAHTPAAVAVQRSPRTALAHTRTPPAAPAAGSRGGKPAPLLTYQAAVNRTLESIHTTVDELIDGPTGHLVQDVVPSDGVVSIVLRDKGTYVVNKQTPTQQLWLSSPVSGPFHYDFVQKEEDGSVRWLDTQTRHSLGEKLTKEFTDIFGHEVVFRTDLPH
eukprot:TRINITY_DN5535_c0_g2_i1.p2 TRINITY_DN5535_c0_g2~~TRINITY_DN5535_c0_g2_i1.p2  ORF type:complete len:164 (+),score=30.86 TRINITY_DN5535_c0_g2_i1:73-564(+)